MPPASLTRRGLIAMLSVLAPPAVAGGAAAADLPALETESYRIPAADPGIELYIRNKRPAGVTSFASDRILLYVHGATYPSETAFDLKLNGLSMMDYIAAQGWDVYLVDVRGYGGSTRPAVMDAPAADNPPFATTEDAVRDVAAAVDHILQRRHVDRINLMGWSWGTATMGMYTSRHNAKVARLVLYAPMWLFESPPLIGGDQKLGAYRTVSKDSARAHSGPDRMFARSTSTAAGSSAGVAQTTAALATSFACTFCAVASSACGSMS